MDENGVATEITPAQDTTSSDSNAADTTNQTSTAPAQDTTSNTTNTTAPSAPAQSTTTTTPSAPAQSTTTNNNYNNNYNNNSSSSTVTSGSKAAAIYAAAYAQIGVNQDCTMLVTNALKAVGINFHSSPEGYLSLGTLTSTPVAGDIIVYSGHVAIYAGNGMAIHGGWGPTRTTAMFSVNCSQALIGYVHIG